MTKNNAQLEPTTTPVAPTKRGGNLLRLDDDAITKVIQAYPTEVHDDVLWLAVYVRERCNRQLSVLEGIAGKLKVSLRENLTYKIFTGRYFIADPQRPGRLIGSVPNFQQAVAKLRKEFRVEQSTGKIVFIETPTWQRVSDYIDVRRAPDRVCKFGVIIGPTGSQKTASLREYCTRNNHGTCVHIEAPHTPSITQFITDLAARYGASIWSNQENKLRTIYGAVTSKRTIVVDNVQRLYVKRRGGDQPIFSFLQKLQDETGCTVILSFTPEFEKVLTDDLDKGYFEQFEGRVGGRKHFLRLEPLAERDDVLAIAAGFGLTIAKTGADIEYLESLAHSKGLIRILFNALQEGQQLAKASDETFTIEHVRAARGEEGK